MNSNLMNTEKYNKIDRCKQINLERIGETILQNCGKVAFIVEYNNFNDIKVQFKDTEEIINTTYSEFKNSNVKINYIPTVFGIGVTGEEITKINGVILKSYEVWKNMLKRCYSKKAQQKQPTYIGCNVCDEWLYYSNFKIWYEKNYYEIEEKTSELDKDILYKGNKIYSPETCVFVPKYINSLFTKSKATRGNLPIGVGFDKRCNKYFARYNNFNIQTKTYKYKTLGYSNTPEEAFIYYKINKKDNIIEIANYLKGKIPYKLYEALLNYEIEITD